MLLTSAANISIDTPLLFSSKCCSHFGLDLEIILVTIVGFLMVEKIITYSCGEGEVTLQEYYEPHSKMASILYSFVCIQISPSARSR